jgi:hypothetical protein
MSTTRGKSHAGFVRRVGSRAKDFILGRDSRKIVFRAQGCGLANRLRALVGYQALARLHKLPFYLTWTADPFCPSEFRDLFDSPINLMYPQALRSVSPRAIYQEAISFENIWKRWGMGIDWVTYLREVHDCLRALTPQLELAEKVAEFHHRHSLSDAIGVHIRNTDNLATYAEWMKHSSDFDPKQISTVAGFIDVIGANIRSRPVFLATDDPELENTLKQRFPALITFPKTYDLTKLRATPMEVALSEMWLLGRCHQVVGTYYSSFSKFSAIWGRVPYFEVIGDQIKRSKFIDRLISTSE